MNVKQTLKEFAPWAWIGSWAGLVTHMLGLLTPLFALVGDDPRLWIALGSGTITLSSSIPWLSQSMAISIFAGIMSLIVLRKVHTRLVNGETDD
ncbi:hypothetical protein [Halobaculum sp. P14]|uniref:hypothetical protein n=1 Tax=Halobaculum sp. P14 TaxID=3421638 RepID=UPI003EBAF285